MSDNSGWSENLDNARRCIKYAYEDLCDGNIPLAYNDLIAALDCGDMAFLIRSRGRELTYGEKSALSDFHYQAVHRLAARAPAQFQLEPL